MDILLANRLIIRVIHKVAITISSIALLRTSKLRTKLLPVAVMATIVEIISLLQNVEPLAHHPLPDIRPVLQLAVGEL